MNDVVSEPQQYHDHHPLLRRRSSISASAPTNLLLPHHNSSSASSTATAATSSFSSFPSDDLELLSMKPASQNHSYTSLKDLLPVAAVNSPKPSPAQSGSDICIRNRLVKQAAWAYLQPMSTSPGSAGDSLFHRLWPRVAAFFDLVRRAVIRAVNWTLRGIWIRSSR